MIEITSASEISEEFLRTVRYNGIDTISTLEVFNNQLPLLEADDPSGYELSKIYRWPVLSMMKTGLPINHLERFNFIESLEGEIVQKQKELHETAKQIWGQGLNPSSPSQVMEFFFTHPQGFKLKTENVRTKEGWRPAANEEVLLRIQSKYENKGPDVVAAQILELRDCQKLKGTLSAKLGRDGRLHTTYNVAGTETGRLSSQKDVFGLGTNLQNLSKAARRIVEAPEGYELLYVDLRGAESVAVGLYGFMASGVDRYLNACESGDIHTAVSRMCWPDLEWPEDLKSQKAFANEHYFVDGWSYRRTSKSLGHGTNYWGSAYGMAKTLKIPVHIVEAFQKLYFDVFPDVVSFQQYVIYLLNRDRAVQNVFGRRRRFFGNCGDSSTIREGIATLPQATVLDVLNVGMVKIWRDWGDGVIPRAWDFSLLAQVHDALLAMVRKPHVEECAEFMVRKMTVPMKVSFESRSREVVIHPTVERGKNWSPKTPKNPEGMREHELA